MAEEFTVLAKRGCPYCIGAIDMLKDRKKKFKVYYAGTDFPVAEFKGKYGVHATYPRIYINKKYIGGYDQLEEHL